MVILISGPAIAKQHKLKPVVGLGPPVDDGISVTFESPDDWQLWAKMTEVHNDVPQSHNDFIRVFVLPGHADQEHPAIQLSIQASVPGKLDPPLVKPIDRRDPWNSSTVTDMKSAGEIKKVRKIGSVDAGENGKLPIWQIRSEAYDCLLVLVVYQHTSVDICLRGDDADSLQKYVGDLKKVARSVRFLLASVRGQVR